MSMRFRHIYVTAVLVVLAAVAIVHASTPRFWHVSTQADFLKGEVENLSVDGDGRLVLGPAAELVYESGAPFLWALAPAPDGGFWAGSGNEGKVFHIDGKGNATTFFDAPELEVHALAPAPDGSLYVGTSPDGKIYKVAADGSSATFFDPDDKYIWALAVGTDGTLYAGTGDKGIIYTIDKEGRGTPLYRTQATHVTALVLEPGGSLLAGTESPGRVFRVSPKGQGFVLLDSEFREIHALRLAENGVIYAAAISGKDSPADRVPDRAPTIEPQRTEPIATVSTEITTISIGDVQVGSSSTAPSSRPQPRDLKGAIYRIAPDGLWDVVWESAEDSPYDLMFDGSGRLIIGTGGKGKLFRVGDDPASAMLLTRAAAQQVTMFLRGKDGGSYYATANPGKVFKLSAGRMDKGVYLSEIRDATTVATWGSIRWRAATPTGSTLQLFTRSGNTARPDETWSPWSPAYRTATGEQISSPKARYLQWKAEFSGSTGSPTLTSVTAAYLERNLRPVVESITVHPPGAAFQKPFSTGELELAGYDDAPPDSRSATAAGGGNVAAVPQLGRRVYQKGLQTFVWKASDDNDDRLLYDVMYRGEGEPAWKVLKRGLTDPVMVWDTSSVPDGTYVVKVVASDSPSNSPGTALSGELESTAFDIDNTPPIIRVSSVRRDGDRSIATFFVEDAQSPVQRVEYSLDANRWRVIYPKDGIPDSRVEEFEVVLDGEAAGRNPIIRATDAMSNAATAVAEAKPVPAK
jgi:hypothetical protein